MGPLWTHVFKSSVVLSELKVFLLSWFLVLNTYGAKMHCTSEEISFNMRCFGPSVDNESFLTFPPHYSFEAALLSVTTAFFCTVPGMSGVTGAALRETSFINRSLSALADVLGAIAEQRAHVPYRNSKLTHLLQDSVGEGLF